MTRARQVLLYIDYLELWASRWQMGVADDLCERALLAFGVRPRRKGGLIVGFREIRRGVWAEEPA